MNEQIQSFIGSLTDYSASEIASIAEAAEWADKSHVNQKRASGDPYAIHPLGTAAILVELKMDADSIIAALLHDVLEDTQVEADEIERRFGKSVRHMVEGVTKIADLPSQNKTKQEAESIRKMLFAMVEDIRVILIKLADKLDNMRTLGHLNEDRRKAIAQECIDIYAPLADRLGISWIKDELEDLSLKHLNHDAYEQIKGLVALKKGERAEFLKKVQDALYHEAAAAGIKITVMSRAKHFYSIYQKIRKRAKESGELYDLLGIRMLCEKTDDCYTLLGLVHKLWKPIDGRFKDYIAMPKNNGYQSLHTTVMCFEGKLIEIQIRTWEMHHVAEYGVAGHWLYKTGGAKDWIQPKEISLVNKLKTWNRLNAEAKQELGTSDESNFLEDIKRELLKDSIYVFTPKGNVIELPSGATPIDFAYQIHSAIGDHCVAAKADGSIVPLTSELKNTQVVEILTSPQAHPHLNWLRAARTSKARSKIRSWLIQNDDTLIIDKNIVAKKRAAQASQATPPTISTAEGTSAGPLQQTILRPADSSTGALQVRVEDEKNMMIHFARCCSPITGDPIVGYVSRGRGIIVHRRNCHNLAHIADFADRKIDVEWEHAASKTLSKFRVEAKWAPDLFSEIEGAIRKYQGHLIEGRLEESTTNRLSGFFTMELENEEDVKKALKSLRNIPSVIALQAYSAD